MSDFPASSVTTYAEIGEVFRKYQSFLLMSHVRPDGDAIGSQVALGFSLMAMGKEVFLINDDGLPENMAFLKGSERISRPPEDPPDVDVAVALDTATKERLGNASLRAAANAKFWLNIDHHKTNPHYGDLNCVEETSAATGEILYRIIRYLDMPLPAESRDAIYVAVATDTGSFRYPSTTEHTHRMAADLLRRGLDAGEINQRIFDDHPFRRIELMRALLETLRLTEDGWVAHWDLRERTRTAHGLMPEDSEGLIDIIRSIRGVRLAIFFEELPEGKIRVSMRSSDKRLDVCQIARTFGGGGHTLAAGIRMPGPLEEAKRRLFDVIAAKVEAVRSAES